MSSFVTIFLFFFYGIWIDSCLNQSNLQVFETVSMIDVWAIREQRSSSNRAASRDPDSGWDHVFLINVYVTEVSKAEIGDRHQF